MSIQHRLATPVIQPRMRFFDTDSKPLVGGKVYAFKVGTEEFKPTYRNSELTALNTNPVVLDGAGSALIYLRGANLLKIYDRHGNFIEERIEYQQRERAQFYDDYGRPLKNGYVYTYDYQSTIRKTSYSIDDVINPNPIVLDENGTALVNIVGAYRLRQYNSKNVFVGDQDFKRPPIKALTSVVYPIYFKENLKTNFNISSPILRQIYHNQSLMGLMGTNLELSTPIRKTVVIYSSINLNESIQHGLNIADPVLRDVVNYKRALVAENIIHQATIENPVLASVTGYIKYRNDESVETAFAISNPILKDV